MTSIAMRKSSVVFMREAAWNVVEGVQRGPWEPVPKEFADCSKAR
jgi:hypothetical protein